MVMGEYVRPTVAFWGARSAYWGPGFEITPHAAGTTVLCVALDGEVHTALGGASDNAEWWTGRSVLVPAGSLHMMRF